MRIDEILCPKSIVIGASYFRIIPHLPPIHFSSSSLSLITWPPPQSTVVDSPYSKHKYRGIYIEPTTVCCAWVNDDDDGVDDDDEKPTGPSLSGQANHTGIVEEPTYTAQRAHLAHLGGGTKRRGARKRSIVVRNATRLSMAVSASEQERKSSTIPRPRVYSIRV